VGLRNAIAEAEFARTHAPRFLRSILVEDDWREVVPDDGGERGRFETFEQFSAAKAPTGLGISVDRLRTIVQSDSTVAALLDEVVLRGSVTKPQDYDRKLEQPRFLPTLRMRRDLRRLAATDRTLHRRVLRGELTLYQAMIQAGLRERTLTIRPKALDSVARALRSRLAPKEIRELLKLLR
jgi:hypothetical protein